MAEGDGRSQIKLNGGKKKKKMKNHRIYCTWGSTNFKCIIVSTEIQTTIEDRDSR